MKIALMAAALCLLTGCADRERVAAPNNEFIVVPAPHGYSDGTGTPAKPGVWLLNTIRGDVSYCEYDGGSVSCAGVN